ncbi:TPA: hypothetical protein P0E12_004975 [Vibrio harveyi]|nr:hypothetical protein [Vibrio harveyi]
MKRWAVITSTTIAAFAVVYFVAVMVASFGWGFLGDIPLMIQSLEWQG